MSDDVTDAGRPDSHDAADEPDVIDLPPLAQAYPQLADWFASDPGPRMPEEVWISLETALAEQTPLSTPGVAGVAAIPVAGSVAGRRPRRLGPLIGAAAGLVLVGAVGIPIVLGGNAAAPPVADGQVEPSVLASAPVSTADPIAEPGEPTVDATAQPTGPATQATDAATPEPVAPTPDTSSVVGPGDAMVVPARLLVASGTDYSAEAMTPQVTNLITSVGLVDGDDMAEDVVTVHSSTPRGMPPLVGAAGFTSDVQALRDCVDRLHTARGGDAAGLAMPALLVDRASFNGLDAGVVVMLHANPGMKPYLDVAVVGPDCTDSDVAAAVWFEYALP